MNLVMLGAPGSGKGTQAELFEKYYGFKHLSTGEMLRSAVKEGTVVGKQIESLLDAGLLVSDEIVSHLLETQIELFALDHFIKGLCIDGFPRTLQQAEHLEQFVAIQKMVLTKVVFFDLPVDVLVNRLSGRRTCSSCGMMFHEQFAPAKIKGICDRCGSGLMQRKDDLPDVIEQRIKIYNMTTQPVVNFYAARGLLFRIAAGDLPMVIFKSIVKELELDSSVIL